MKKAFYIFFCFLAFSANAQQQNPTELALNYLLSGNNSKFEAIAKNHKSKIQSDEQIESLLFTLSYGARNEKLAVLFDEYYEYPSGFDLASVAFNFCSNGVGSSKNFYEYTLSKLVSQNSLRSQEVKELVFSCVSMSAKLGNDDAVILLVSFFNSQDFSAELYNIAERHLGMSRMQLMKIRELYLNELNGTK